MARVLVVEDELEPAGALHALLPAQLHDVVIARSRAEALQLLEGVDAVVAGFRAPDPEALDWLEKCRERDELLPIIAVTARAATPEAAQALQQGTFEHLIPPLDASELAAALERALGARTLRSLGPALAAGRVLGQPVVSDSPAMRRVLEAVARVAPREVSVLIRGERGTGKKLVAALLHAQSPRAAAPFVRFNCAAIAGRLAEAELFGHVRGAFAGAAQARTGAFAQADRGVLLLEEVAELPLALQGEVLRVLEEGEIQPLGAARVEKVDVRALASTSCDLAAQVREGRFCAELYYRLAAVEIALPPLRERREDIPALIEAFLRRSRERFDAQGVRLSPELVRMLAADGWPGNLHELQKAVSQLVALAPPGELGPEAFARVAPRSIASAAPASPPGTAAEPVAPAEPPAPPLLLWQRLEKVERELIAQMLSSTGGNQSAAARRLGVSRSALIKRLKKYGLAPVCERGP